MAIMWRRTTQLLYEETWAEVGLWTVHEAEKRKRKEGRVNVLALYHE